MLEINTRFNLCVWRGEGKGDGNKTRAVPLLEFQGLPWTPRVSEGAGGATPPKHHEDGRESRKKHRLRPPARNHTKKEEPFQCQRPRSRRFHSRKRDPGRAQGASRENGGTRSPLHPQGVARGVAPPAPPASEIPS